MPGIRSASSIGVDVAEVQKDGTLEKRDNLAAEEPMELRVFTRNNGTWEKHPIAITMRTPGNDFELAAGFLVSEGVVSKPDEIFRITYCNDPREDQNFNMVDVYLENVSFDFEKLSRHVYTSSSCGICGKGSIKQINASCSTKPVGDFKIRKEILTSLPDALRTSQEVFSKTGGLHASALFDKDGGLILVREDVGRHNALDKVVGSLLLGGKLPASNTVLLVSGRASFELVQKSLLAGIPFLAAVGAPSSLAVDLATEYEMTLVGFLREDRFNVYTGLERIITDSRTTSNVIAEPRRR